MIEIERQSLPRIGQDEPSCPKCGGYNAMLHYSYEEFQHDDTKCRDCGLIHLVRDHDPLEQLRDYERSHPEHQALPEDSLPSGCTLSDLEMEVPTD